MLETTRWVCRSGSPARESRWSNAAATRPVTGTCRMPPLPTRVNATSRSSIARVERTAAAWAASTWPATSGGASAHSAETDFTGLKVRSYPATGTCAGRDAAARKPVSSASSRGGRPCSRANAAVATVVRIRARSSAGIGAFHGRPSAGVVVAERLRDLLAQRGRGEGREGAAERAPSPGGRLRLPGAGVPALAEEQPHLLLGDRVPVGEVEPGQAGPHPPARRLALLLVVARQPGLPDLGRVVGRDLPGQVRVPAPGGELVQSHHIWKSLRGGPSWTCRCGINHFSAPGVFLNRGG